EKREELASLVQEKLAAVDESERFREANQNLKLYSAFQNSLSKNETGGRAWMILPCRLKKRL
ncbi:hypothetical protein V5799_011242, partial [Amblyomma americanum]